MTRCSRLLGLLLLCVTNIQTFGGIAPRFTLFKNSSLLIKPYTQEQRQYRKHIAKLIFQEKNCTGIIGVTRLQAFSKLGQDAYRLLDKYYTSDTDILVLKKKGEIAGILLFLANQEDLFLDIVILVVDEKYHHRGYGKMLMSELHRNFPGYTARLSVFKENTKALVFYKKLKYYLVSETPHCFDLDKKL